MTLNAVGSKTLSTMIEEELISSVGNFDIDERLLHEYMRIYDFYSKSKLNAKYDLIFTRKMAGLTLMKEKQSRGISPRDFKEGFVYFIRNPAWPKHTKVGLCTDVSQRLATYQTYDPFRSYKVESYEFVLNRRDWEKYILNKYQVNPDRGEWIPHTKSFQMIRDIRERIESLMLV